MPTLTIKAGRSVRRSEDSNWVDPMPVKGKLELEASEDGFLTFAWKARSGSEVDDEEYIIFPGDCTFTAIPSDPSGKSAVLKFSSSDSRHFYWFQDADARKYAHHTNNINSLIQDLDYQPVAFDPATAPAVEVAPPPAFAQLAAASTSFIPSTPAIQPPTTAVPATPHPQRTADLFGLDAQAARAVEATPSHAPVGAAAVGGVGLGARSPGGSVFSQEQVDALARILGGVRTTAPREDAHLTDILTPANLKPLIASNPSLITALVPHLPSSLPLSSPPTPAEINEIIASPQFHEAVEGFDAALRTGGLRGFMRGLGMPESAGDGVGEFLDECEKKGKDEREGGGGGAGAGGSGGDAMETD